MQLPRNCIERFGSARIQLFHSWVVRRHGRKAPKDLRDESFFGQTEQVICPAFIAQGRFRAFTHARAAKEPCAVSRIDLNAIGKGFQAKMQALKQFMGEPPFGFLTEQVRQDGV